MNHPPDSPDNKKEQAAFFTQLMKEGGNWDEHCIQWCKQSSSGSQEQKPNCSMLCLKRSAEDSWNPFKGYRVVAIQGKDQCSNHIEAMSQNEVTQYEFDLNDIWQEADRQAKQVLNDTAIPLYNQSVEQLIGWGTNPELQDYIKSTASSLLSKVYPLKPFQTDNNTPPSKES
ncbi:hypothetical protein BD560DRAFT_389669 [Blakeslea trispora]|nr:hypothetical protein BD560DRAFT_389669 [Blakeslea trispora]